MTVRRIPSVLDEPNYTKMTVAAIQALWAGTASGDQQRVALEFIVTHIARTNEITFTPDALGGSRDQDFREGKRFVGRIIRKIVETPLDGLVKD